MLLLILCLLLPPLFVGVLFLVLVLLFSTLCRLVLMGKGEMFALLSLFPDVL